MSAVVLVTPQRGAAEQILPALAHSAHQIRVVPATLEALDAVTGADAPTDVILIDARQDLAAARRLCTLLAAQPVLLILPPAALGLIDADWGCNDFVVDPVTPAELEARLRLLAGPLPAHVGEGPVTVDEAAYQATLAGRRLDLTYTEFELLKFFVANPRRVHSREVLLAEVWGYDYYGGTRTVDVHVRRLRAKFGVEYEGLIETIRNVGYRFDARGA